MTLSKSLDSDYSRFLYLSNYCSAFDYDMLKLLILTYLPVHKLNKKIKKYKKMFKICSTESFKTFFKPTNPEVDESSEVELKVKVNISKNMRDVKKKMCGSLKSHLKIDHLRLLTYDQSIFTFGATFQGSIVPLSKLNKKSLEEFKGHGITELKLQNFCIYGLDGKQL